MPTCNHCDGRGFVAKKLPACENCKGAGHVRLRDDYGIESWLEFVVDRLLPGEDIFAASERMMASYAFRRSGSRDEAAQLMMLQGTQGAIRTRIHRMYHKWAPKK